MRTGRWVVLLGIGLMLSVTQGLRAQERSPSKVVLDDIRTNLAALEDQRAVALAERGEDSELAQDLAKRIRRLKGAISALGSDENGARGGRLTLNFQATPLKEVLDFLADKTGLNFAYAQNALDPQDRVTARMRDIAAVDAAVSILTTVGYTFSLQPGQTIAILGKNDIDMVRREAEILQAEVEILQLLIRKQQLERQIERENPPGESVQRKLELTGVLLEMGSERILVRTEARGDVVCHLTGKKTESGWEVHPEVAAILKPLKIGDRVQFRCLLREKGWLLQWIGKAE